MSKAVSENTSRFSTGKLTHNKDLNSISKLYKKQFLLVTFLTCKYPNCNKIVVKKSRSNLKITPAKGDHIIIFTHRLFDFIYLS